MAAIIARTSRLVLREPTAADVEAVLAYASLPAVGAYLPSGVLDRDGVRARIDRWRSALQRRPSDDIGSDWTLGLLVEADGAVVGDVMLKLLASASGSRAVAEVGYVFDPSAGGRGYATEATAALVDLAFSHFGCHRVFATLDPRNHASARVCERLGMLREADLREDWFDGDAWVGTCVYGVLRREWSR